MVAPLFGQHIPNIRAGAQYEDSYFLLAGLCSMEILISQPRLLIIMWSAGSLLNES